MKESFEDGKEYFKYPNIEAERGEFERVSRTFNVDIDTLMFLAAEESRLIPLNASIWDVLENTDSNRLEKGNWGEVQACSEAHTRIRDWKKFKNLEESSEPIAAPIILKFGDIYHLVAGNTRLMVARALGITPMVLMFEYKQKRTDE